MSGTADTSAQNVCHVVEPRNSTSQITCLHTTLSGALDVADSIILVQACQFF